MIDRPKEPPKFDDEVDFGDAFPKEPATTPGEAVPEERPTVSPPFDVEEYAKASDSNLRAARTPSPQNPDPSTKPPPPIVDFDLDEDDIPHALGGGAGARSVPPPAKKQAPAPAPAKAAPARPVPARAPTLGTPPPMRAPQITQTDEDELEMARIRSVMMPSDPPPALRPNVAPPKRSGVADVQVEDSSPATVAYPAEYEKDPFARLSPPTSERAAGGGQLGEMRDKFSLGDYTGALELAEDFLQKDPGHIEAATLADESRNKLLQMYTGRIGPMDRVPMVMVPREQLRWLSIDHRAGFLLSHIDGVSSLEMILDVSGMPLLDALKILCELAQQRVISFR